MVSYRRSLYRQSGSRGVHNHKNEIEEHVNYWRRVWITPTLSTTSTGSKQNVISTTSSSSVTSLQSSTGAVNPNNSGSVITADINERDASSGSMIKTWAMYVNSSDYMPVEDGDADDMLDLAAAAAENNNNITARNKEKKAADNQSKSGGLTEADIRGAVGGDGTDIAGYSVGGNTGKEKSNTSNTTSANDEPQAAQNSNKLEQSTEKEVKGSKEEDVTMTDITEASSLTSNHQVSEEKNDELKSKESSETSNSIETKTENQLNP